MSPRRPSTVVATPERRIAHDVLVRIERHDAWVAPVLDAALGGADLDDRERRQATELVYGVTRQRRRLDHLIRPHIDRDPDIEMRAALRIGTLQLIDHGIEPHAAVSQAVALVPTRARGFANAVLRRVAEAGAVPIDDPAVALSYPDWILSRLSTDIGAAEARRALEAMNQPADTPARADGYRQDPASVWVTDLVDARPGDLVADLCAAPGGKATGLATAGAHVVALEIQPGRARRLAATTSTLASSVSVVAAGAGRAPLRPARFDRVLLDAPCSGLGALRRRADARWRIRPDAIDRLARIQVGLLVEAATLVRDGGRLVYSACTLTRAETVDVVVEGLASAPELTLADVDRGDRWRGADPGVMVLPQDHHTDGMYAAVFDVRRGST